MEEAKITIYFDYTVIDEMIDKVNRLVELLREAQQIIDSLSRAEKSEYHMQ